VGRNIQAEIKILISASMKRILVFYFLILSHASYGQRYSFAQINAQADSLLSVQAGPLYAYCHRDVMGSYYSYMAKGDKRFKKWGKRKTSKHFIAAAVHYNFSAPYPMCPCMDTIHGSMTVKLDTALLLAEKTDLSFIPQFVKAHDSCRFIDKQKAIDIALRQNLHTSVSAPYAYIKSTDYSNSYVWVVLRAIWDEKNTSGTAQAKDDIVVIDALTGEVQERK
jgi:hypothetical protein